MRYIFRVVAITVISLLLKPSVAGQRCDCIAASTNDTTRHGGNEDVVAVGGKAHQTLCGVVRDPNGEPLHDVLVEVYDHPEIWSTSRRRSQSTPPEQRRVAACISGTDGRFCFLGLASGCYELRFSIGAEWDVLHMLVRLEPQKARSTSCDIEATMVVGT
jgi:protocatechuate 3,4-dioxygenase beta subunit